MLLLSKSTEKWKRLSSLVEITGTVGDTLNFNHSTDTTSTALLILILIKLFVFCKVIIFPKEEHY